MCLKVEGMHLSSNLPIYALWPKDTCMSILPPPHLSLFLALSHIFLKIGIGAFPFPISIVSFLVFILVTTLS